MAKFKKYVYPLFMGASGLLTTVSDLIQKNEIALTLAVFLTVVGLITLATPVNMQLKLARLVSEGIDEGFSPRSFGCTCLLLAAAVFGFSTLSVKAAPEGGIIASQYPEIQQMQTKLGVIEKTTARIEDKTDRILTATRQWISIPEFGGHIKPSNVTYIDLGLENNTPYLFTDMSVTITSKNKKHLEIDDGSIGSGAYYRHMKDIDYDILDGFDLCIKSKSSVDNKHYKEIITYIVKIDEHGTARFNIVKTTNALQVLRSDNC